MAIRPAFQFYPADWRNNAKLRRCSLEARGAWVDVMCLLHDSDEYGVLRWPLADIAQAAGVPVKLLRELASKSVLKGADENADPFVFTPRHGGKDGDPVTLVTAMGGPCWYCSRFVRDEYVRQRRGVGSRFDSENNPNRKPQEPKQTDRAKFRALVWGKTNGHCAHCKCVLPPDAWHIDHFIPRAKGGSNLLSNLVPSCVSCNQDKADSMPDDWVPNKQPTRRIGVRQGDGASSSSSSSVEQELPITSGASAPADPIWGVGLAFLIRKGIPDRQARSLLGQLRKAAGDVQTGALLTDAEAQDISDPAAWLMAAAAKRAREGPKTSKPSAAADFRGKTYAATPIDQLPPDLRAAAERAMRDD